MAKLNLSTPWSEYYEELSALFKNDKDIHIVYDDDKKEMTFYVDKEQKAKALEKFIGFEREFGNVIVKIAIVPANSIGTKKVSNSDDPGAMVKDLFAGNPIVDRFETIENFFGGEVTYVIFKKEIVQFFDDNISSFYGLKSMLYEDIAKDIFNAAPGVYFCTSNHDSTWDGYVKSMILNNTRAV